MTSVAVTTWSGTWRSSNDEVTFSCRTGSAGRRRAFAAHSGQQVFPQGLHSGSIVRSLGSAEVLPHGLSRDCDNRQRMGRIANNFGTRQGSGPLDAVAHRAEAAGK